MTDAHRGWTIAGTTFVYLDAGAYADIFVDLRSNRVRKVFRVRPSRAAAGVSCANEIAAYIAAMKHDEVRKLVPTFWGERILAQSRDRSSEFYLDLCYEVGRIEGRFQKFSTLSCDTKQALRAKFGAAGIHGLVDASSGHCE